MPDFMHQSFMSGPFPFLRGGFSSFERFQSNYSGSKLIFDPQGSLFKAADLRFILNFIGSVCAHYFP